MRSVMRTARLARLRSEATQSPESVGIAFPYAIFTSFRSILPKKGTNSKVLFYPLEAKMLDHYFTNEGKKLGHTYTLDVKISNMRHFVKPGTAFTISSVASYELRKGKNSDQNRFQTSPNSRLQSEKDNHLYLTSIEFGENLFLSG